MYARIRLFYRHILHTCILFHMLVRGLSALVEVRPIHGLLAGTFCILYSLSPDITPLHSQSLLSCTSSFRYNVGLLYITKCPSLFLISDPQNPVHNLLFKLLPLHHLNAPNRITVSGDNRYMRIHSSININSLLPFICELSKLSVINSII